jgi:hypothetical protein
MLGPSIMFCGAPIALIGSIWAVRKNAKGVERFQWAAVMAMALSTLETLMVLLMLGVMLG